MTDWMSRRTFHAQGHDSAENQVTGLDDGLLQYQGFMFVEC